MQWYFADLTNLLIYAVSRGCPEKIIDILIFPRFEISPARSRCIATDVDVSLDALLSDGVVFHNH